MLDIKNAVLLDLFSGKGNFHNGLIRSGFKFKKTYFSEIDIHAIANYTRSFPDARYIGSVSDIRGTDIERPNIITFGSPCQDFSLAGARKGMDGERSSLISEAIRIITETRPDVFIWENVKGAFSSNDGADFWSIIKAFTNIRGYRLEWQLLNTSWFLPQNRERIYLVGTLATSRRSSGDIFPIREKSSGINERTKQTADARCLTAGGNSGGMHSSMTLIKQVGQINSSQDGKVFDPDGHSQCLSAGHGNVPKIQIKQLPRGNNKGGLHDKCPTITPNSFEHNNHVVGGTLRTHKDGEGFRATSDGICPTIPARARAREDGSGQPCVQIGAIRGRNPKNPKSRESGLETQQMLEINETGNTNCLTSVQKDNAVVQGQSIRRLTEIECERLQGSKDNSTKYGLYLPPKIQRSIFKKVAEPTPDEIREYCLTLNLLKDSGQLIEKEVPATQRYRILGNTVTEDAVEAVGVNIIKVLKT